MNTANNVKSDRQGVTMDIVLISLHKAAAHATSNQVAEVAVVDLVRQQCPTWKPNSQEDAESLIREILEEAARAGKCCRIQQSCHWMPIGDQQAVAPSICKKCQERQEKCGSNKNELGLTSKEIIAMITEVLSQDEAEAGERHCFCNTCLQLPLGKTSECRLEGRPLKSAKVEENMKLFRRHYRRVQNMKVDKSIAFSSPGSKKKSRSKIKSRKSKSASDATTIQGITPMSASPREEVKQSSVKKEISAPSESGSTTAIVDIQSTHKAVDASSIPVNVPPTMPKSSKKKKKTKKGRSSKKKSRSKEKSQKSKAENATASQSVTSAPPPEEVKQPPVLKEISAPGESGSPATAEIQPIPKDVHAQSIPTVTVSTTPESSKKRSGLKSRVPENEHVM